MKPQVQTAVAQPEVKLQQKNVAPCSCPCQHQTKANDWRNHPFAPFPQPHFDDPAVDAVGSKLLKVRSKKKKKRVEGLIIKPSVRDHGLSTLRIVENEERQQKRVDESPPCNPTNAASWLVASY